MKNARPATDTRHRAHRREAAIHYTDSIPPRQAECNVKSQSIVIFNGDTDEQKIMALLGALPPEYVRKVRIYAQALFEIFAL